MTADLARDGYRILAHGGSIFRIHLDTWYIEHRETGETSWEFIGRFLDANWQTLPTEELFSLVVEIYFAETMMDCAASFRERNQ